MSEMLFLAIPRRSEGDSKASWKAAPVVLHHVKVARDRQAPGGALRVLVAVALNARRAQAVAAEEHLDTPMAC